MACRLIQCWNIDNWTHRNKLLWNVNRNWHIFIKKRIRKCRLEKRRALCLGLSAIKCAIIFVIETFINTDFDCQLNIDIRKAGIFFVSWYEQNPCHRVKRISSPRNPSNIYQNRTDLGSNNFLVGFICGYVSQTNQESKIYRQISNIRRTESQNLNVSGLVLQLSLCFILRPSGKSRMKM